MTLLSMHGIGSMAISSTMQWRMLHKWHSEFLTQQLLTLPNSGQVLGTIDKHCLQQFLSETLFFFFYSFVATLPGNFTSSICASLFW
ncbi:hypothetical protein BJX64DRAFT_208029 [Aspergillus heterothallicus]